MRANLLLVSSLLGVIPCASQALAAESNDHLFIDRREVDDYSGLISTPIISRLSVGDVRVKITVPIVQFSSAASAGFYADSAVQFGSGPDAPSYAELGDVTVKATRSVWRSRGGLSVDMSARAKFATGSVKNDIGSGRGEAALMFDIVKPLRPFELGAGIAYHVRHSYTSDPALNGLSTYVGTSYSPTRNASIDLTYEYTQASEQGDAAERLLSLSFTHQTNKKWALRSYASLDPTDKRTQELGFTLAKRW